MDYNRVQIADLYLTSDGTSMGKPCRVDIPGLMALRPKFRRTVVQAIEGPPAVQLFDNLVGEQLSMTLFVVNKEEYDDLIEIIDDADDTTGSIINVKLREGDLGEFDLDCVLVTQPEQPGEFRNGRIPSITLVWSIVAVNEIEDEED